MASQKHTINPFMQSLSDKGVVQIWVDPIVKNPMIQTPIIWAINIWKSGLTKCEPKPWLNAYPSNLTKEPIPSVK